MGFLEGRGWGKRVLGGKGSLEVGFPEYGPSEDGRVGDGEARMGWGGLPGDGSSQRVGFS